MVATGLLRSVVLGCVLAVASFSAHPQSLDRPLLVVASPEATGLFSRAVMVVVPKGDGHVGFMINRATRTTVASAFPDEPDSAKVIEPIYLGGPREAQSMYAVLRRDPGEGSRKLFGDVFVTVSGATVDRILKESPREARYFAGFAVWDAGQLAREIGEGDWLVTEAEESVVFHPQPDAVWGELLKRIRSTY
jgi:putative transcriptional regulator